MSNALSTTNARSSSTSFLNLLPSRKCSSLFTRGNGGSGKSISHRDPPLCPRGRSHVDKLTDATLLFTDWIGKLLLNRAVLKSSSWRSIQCRRNHPHRPLSFWRRLLQDKQSIILFQVHISRVQLLGISSLVFNSVLESLLFCSAFACEKGKRLRINELTVMTRHGTPTTFPQQILVLQP
jgi:hypothetical protein